MPFRIPTRRDKARQPRPRLPPRRRANDPAASIYVTCNGWSGNVASTLPAPQPGRAWYRVSDTVPWMEEQGNFTKPGQEQQLGGGTYGLAGRSFLLLIEH